MGRFIGLLLAVIVGVALNTEADQGRYFAKKRYEPHTLPVFETAKNRLPLLFLWAE